MVHDTLLSKDESTHQIWNSYLKEYKRYALDTIILRTRSEVKVTMTIKWYVTFHQPKMHLHTKFGIPISKNIGDMHQTQCSFWKLGQRSSSKSQRPNYGRDTCHRKMHLHPKFEIPTSNNIREMLRTRLF